MRHSARYAAAALAAAVVAACTGGRAPMPRTEAAAPAWDAWRAGDFNEARMRADALLARDESLDEARHLRVLAAHVTGDYPGAIAAYEAIGPRYRRLSELDEPVLWSYVHAGDMAGARAFAESRGMTRNKVTRERLRLAVERPLRTEIAGVVELAFTDDALTPFFPGFEARVNGHPAVARLDTGGVFVHLSAEQAAAYGVETVACERSFAALRFARVCHGVADLELGPVRLRNAPVAVHHGALPAEQIASAFGVELGPIIGTNVLQQFLTTVDSPRRRLILSARADPAARAAHLARLGGDQAEIPFAMWSDHLMIARGSVDGYQGLNFFVDSGLVAATEAQGQAAMLAPRGALADWRVPTPARNSLAELPGDLALGPVAQEGMTASAVSDATWRNFGDWGGVRVDALISYGFLKRYAWTIDFDRRVYLFRDGETRGGRH